MIKTNEQTKQTISKTGVAVVDFWAPWCGPCKMMGPIIDSLAKNNDDISILKVNVDDSQEMAVKYQIRNIPTLLFFKDGEAVEKLVGVRSEKDIQQIIDELRS